MIEPTDRSALGGCLDAEAGGYRHAVWQLLVQLCAVRTMIAAHTLYVRLSTEALTDPKTLTAGPLGFAVWVKGLLWAKQHLTDGFVPNDAIPLLMLGIADPESVTRDILRAGLWQACDNGFTVGAKRWAKYQVTREEVEGKRAQWAERQRRKRERHAHVTRDSRVTHADVTLPEYRVQRKEEEPVQVPKCQETNDTSPSERGGMQGGDSPPQPPSAPEKIPSRDDELRETFDAFWAQYPRKVAKPKAARAWRKLDLAPETVVALMAALLRQKTCDQWVRDGGEFIPHPATWLNQRRWEDVPMNGNGSARPQGFLSAAEKSSLALRRVIAAAQQRDEGEQQACTRLVGVAKAVDKRGNG